MTDPIRPRRSVLYVPGSNARALEKAKSLAADALILDLEDSVAPDAKDEARELVRKAVSAGGYGAKEVVIRANAPGTEWGLADIGMAATSGANALLIPKVSTPADLEAVRQLLARTGSAPALALWAMIETPLAVLEAGRIAAAARHTSYPLEVLVLGTNDLAKETRAALLPGRQPMLAWLSITVAAGRAHGLDTIDGVYNAFQDLDGFRTECEQGRTLGMDGKTVIHPGQIGVANEIFSPTPQEIAAAEKIVAAFERPENAGKGAISIDGRMVERLHRDMALQVLAIRTAIERIGDSGSSNR
ncbi:MAG: CoA ester lyase [Hyphomicrobiaceae bacterium]